MFSTTILLFTFFLSACSASTWIPLAPIPLEPRQEHTTVFLPPFTVAILGGIIPVSPNSSDPNSTTTYTTTDIVQFYSISSNTWTLAPPLPVPLNHPNAAVVNEKIYVLGGLAQAETAWAANGGCWVYDPKIGQWEELKDESGEGVSMPDPRGSTAVGVWDGKVILAGGLRKIELVSPFEQETVDTVSIYDTTQNIWIDVPDAAQMLPDTRDHTGYAVINRTFYVVGGRQNGQLRGKNTTLILDLDNLAMGWTTASSLMPTGRAGLAAAAIGQNIYTFGGEGNVQNAPSYVFNETEVYDVEKDTWEVLKDMEMPRHGTAAISAGGRIYIPGGGDVIGQAPVDYFDVFVP